MDLLTTPHTFLKGKRIFGFPSRSHLLDVLNEYQGLLVALNAEKILNRDRQLEELLNSNLCYTDGIGAVLAVRQKKIDCIKIPGAELWLSIVEAFQHDKSFYFVGGTDAIIEATIQKLKADFPDLNIKGYRNGFFKEGDEARLMEDLQDKKPDVVYVAMGSPKQEYLMQRLFKKHPALYQGLGGSFDVYTGSKKRAPKFFCVYGLEWFYRLVKEPTRIKRQLVLVKFLILLILRKI